MVSWPSSWNLQISFVDVEFVKKIILKKYIKLQVLPVHLGYRLFKPSRSTEPPRTMNRKNHEYPVYIASYPLQE